MWEENVTQFAVVPTGYKLIKGVPDKVEQDVNSLLKDGWIPRGELLTFNDLVIQAMIRYPESS
jgi:hypothetical protein